MIWLIAPATALLLLSIILAGYYVYGLERARYPRQPVGLICGIAVLFLAGTIMLFIATGWRWGLVGLGISCLTALAVTVRTAIKANKHVNPLIYWSVKKVFAVKEQHHAELEIFWRMTSAEERASLVVAFAEALKNQWPREYSAFHPEKLPHEISENFQGNILWAYTAGYMRGKGWISMDQLSFFSIHLGDTFANDVRTVLKGTKPKGIAFDGAYAAVAARGHAKVWSRGSR